MLRSKLLAAAAGAAMLTAMSPAAHAGYAYGVSVDYWSYDGSAVGTNADFGNPITSTTPDATFFYAGPVNWVYNGPQSGPNSVDTFLNINDVASFSSPSGKFASEADFGSSTLSISGDATSAFFWILGAGNFGTVSVTHDDGAVMYVDSYANPVIWSPGETVAVTNTAQVAPGFHEYVVTYVEGNGAPSVLQVAVPEPATWAMMLLGFAGFGFAGYRRARATHTLA